MGNVLVLLYGSICRATSLHVVYARTSWLSRIAWRHHRSHRTIASNKVGLDVCLLAPMIGC